MKKILIVLIPIILIIANIQFFFYKEVRSYPELNDFFMKDKPVTNYSEQEVTHLQEVKTLLKNSLNALMVSLLFFTIASLALKKKALINNYLYGLIFTLILIIPLFLFKFDFIFIKFHEILFTGTNWLLPEDSLLIQQFPQEYFLRIALNIGLAIIIEVILGIIFLSELLRKIKT